METDEVDPSLPGVVVPRGRITGPLATLTPVFIDVETFMTKDISLGKMTLRQYLDKSYLETIAIAIGDEEPSVFATPEGLFKPEDMWLRRSLDALALDPNYVFVAHNAAFDIRVLRFCLGVPQPVNVWCSMEGAMGAWPELPGGYSLENVAVRLRFPKNLQKMEVDLLDITEEEKKEYNMQDVRVLQEIYYRQAPLIPPLEQEVALRTNRQRRFFFEIDQDKLDSLIDKLKEQAKLAEDQADQYITADEHKNIFNRDSGQLHSIRSKRLLKVINERMNAGFNSTSLKKISPIKLASKPVVAALLQQTSRCNRMLHHQRRSMIFTGITRTDVELGYMRAHTGRFSSPSVGRGLNLHNIPKHDKDIAEPVRKTYRLPPDLCFVRADLANVEYRIEGKLCNCQTVVKMFDPMQGGSVFNDPYCQAWLAMTRQKITKKDPMRQVAKSAVLGLGFCMGAAGYAKTLLVAMADKKSGVNEEVVKKIAVDLGWQEPNGGALNRIQEKLGCTRLVALAAFHIHQSFNKAHPEFSMIADWIVRAVDSIAGCYTDDQAKRILDVMYNSVYAPDRDLIGLSIEPDPLGRRWSVRVACGPWVPTVCWREPKVRPTNFIDGASDKKLTIIKATKQFKPFTRQLAIENVTQAAARNMLCWAVAELDKAGFPDVLHIHDELLIIVPRKRENVLAARDAMVKIIGPNGYAPLGWAVLVKPSEISVTESMWESEEDITPPYLDKKTNTMKGGDRWGKIERDDPGCLDNLP